MSDLREALRRGSERFVLSPGGLERLHRRRRRRQRNRRLGVGVLTLTLAAGGTLFAVRAFQRVRPAPRPADEPRVVEIASIEVRPAAMPRGEARYGFRPASLAARRRSARRWSASTQRARG